MGICFSCVSRKGEGTVRNVLTGEESSLPDEDIRICVSRPRRRLRRRPLTPTNFHRKEGTMVSTSSTIDPRPPHQLDPPAGRRPRNKLTPEQIEAFGKEMDAIRQRLISELGEEDAAYIRGVVKKQRQFEVAGRALMYLPPAWPLAVAALSVSKILDNMEIGHNVMHGQYDWMGDPGLNSRMYEWDNVCPSEQWKYSHNYIHHTFTNILGKDRDIGYGILRMDEDQKWHPYYLGNPVYAFLLMVFFEWGVAMHDLEVENIVKGKRSIADNKALHSGIMRKVKQAGAQGLPALPGADRTAVPAHAGGQRDRQPGAQHLGVQHHLLRPLPGRGRDVQRGGVRGRVARALVLPPAARLGQHQRRQAVPPDERATCRTRSSTTCSPTCPARRYPEIAGEIREICERYGLDYNTGPLHKQLFSVARKICRMALPGGRYDRRPSTAPSSPSARAA